MKVKANKPGLFHPFIALTCSKAREAGYRFQYNASQPPWLIRFHISTERAFSVDADTSSDLVLTREYGHQVFHERSDVDWMSQSANTDIPL